MPTRLSPLVTQQFPKGGGVSPSRSSDGLLTPTGSMMFPRPGSAESGPTDRQYRPPSSILLSNQNRSKQGHHHHPALNGKEDDEDSIPDSPKEGVITESVLAATMRTKVFLKQAHSQWKSLGSAKLHVFIQNP